MDNYVIDEEREKREIEAKFDELMAACRANKILSHKEEEDILRAFNIARKAHDGTRRKSGEPYIFHPLEVALIAVREVGLGPITAICALLHDVVEDTDITLDELRVTFGERVANIVDGVTKIEDVMGLQQAESKQAENYRKILLSMCNDAYVIFLKLCDRLHNMRTLGSMKDTKKLAISSETQYLYIPLAHRLGLYAIKTELEELVMRYTNPERYATIAAQIGQTAGTEARLKECLFDPIRAMLDADGYKYSIKTRVKSVYSCWKKMENKGVDFDEIYDLYAMRIILDVPPEREKEECFKVYALLTRHYTPNPTRFRDWITRPKNNGYESLQTTVMTPIGRWVEVQIRSRRMDDIAEKGMAAHFLYKEAHPEKNEVSPVEEWLQQIRTTLENTEKSALDLVEEFKETLYTKEIYLFTPKGDTIKLPTRSTVLDFAFAIHSDLGLHCIGAKVNAKVVSISHKLQSGDQIQVLTSRNTVPTDDWLNIVQTARAKEMLKGFLREQRKVYREEGEQKLNVILSRLNLNNTPDVIGQMKRYFNLASSTDLLYQIAKGGIEENEVAQCFGKAKAKPELLLLEPYEQLFDSSDKDVKAKAPRPDGAEQASPCPFILEERYEHIATEAAPCCKPVQGDQVVGIVTGDRIMVHRTNCKACMDEMANHENHIVRTKWRAGEKVSFLTGLAVTAIDRLNLLQDIVKVVSEDPTLYMRAITFEATEGLGRGIIMLYVHNLDNLRQLMVRIRQVDGIEDVRRI